jgi:hypothetical protein
MLSSPFQRGRAGSVLGLLVSLTLTASPARAAATDAELAAARRLFVEAEKDEDGARWADALDKLRRVSQVKLTAGIHYHVALCEEHLGQLARALDEYTVAEGQAREEKANDVLSLVGKRIADLRPRVPRLTLRLGSDVPDAVVTVDGAAVPSAVRGTAMPIDPGEHRIEAASGERRATPQAVTMHERDAIILVVQFPEAPPPPGPALQVAPPAVAPSSPATLPSPSADTPSASAGAPSRALAVVATAGAVVLAGGGLAAFLLAGSAHGRAVEQCAQKVTLAPGACDGEKNEVRGWDFTAGAAWLGAGVVGALAVLAWTNSEPRSASAQLLVGPRSVGLGGRF